MNAALAAMACLITVAITNGAFRLFYGHGRRTARAVLRVKQGAEPASRKRKRAALAVVETGEAPRTGIALAVLEKLRLRGQVEALLEQAGLAWRPAGFVRASLACGIGLALIAQHAAGEEYPWAALPAGTAGAALLPVYVRRRAAKRLARFEEQFPDCLEFVSRSMRAGHAFAASLEMISQEFREPLASEFKRVYEEQNLGLPLQAALEKLGRRIPMVDVHFFVSAVLLQKRTGGNLAEILDKLAQIIRERFKLRGRIKAITAHGRMTGSILSLIPAAVAAILFAINPQYGKFFFGDPTGRMMLAGSVGMQLVGYAVMRKIVSIEV